MKKSINEYRLDFLDYLSQARGYSQLTVKSYNEVLQEALQYIEIVEDPNITINLMPYRVYISALHAKTIAKKLSALRSFVDFLTYCGERITLQADESIKVPKTLPKPIAHHHIQEALQLGDEQESLVVLMLYTLGLRISELALLELSDISSQWIRILGKGSKHRDVPLLETTYDAIESYKASYHPKKFLFEKKGQRLSENSLRYIITKMFKRIGLKVTPHQLRHSFATELLNHDASIVDVSELLGHASMATTQIYTQLGSSVKRQNYHKAHPLCKDEK